tara:strand:+ start:1114 stop:1734 length:621 start_codon:yes stop_codon:yes gene_type:complete
MKIDSVTYKLSENNYTNQGTKKDKIVIGITNTTKMAHYKGWTKRFNGKYKKTAMFTIGIDGRIYEHFSPNFFSNYMGSSKLTESTITILLENEGWLNKDLTSKNKYINYVGHIYNRKETVIEKNWRGQKYWAPFTEEQISSAIKLTSELCDKFNIPVKVISHNTNIDNADNYKGVLYRSNFNKHYTDITPAWNCKYFKNKLENDEK